MEILQTVIVIECVVLCVLLCATAGYFYLQTHRVTDLRVFGLLYLAFYYCAPGVLGAVSPTFLRIVIPLAHENVELVMAIALPLMVASVFAGLLVRFGRPKMRSPEKQRKLARQLAMQYRPGRLFLVSFGFFCLGAIGVYKDLEASGGLFSLIGGGGAAYSKLVTGVVGFWGLLICFVPISAIGMMYGTVMSRSLPRRLRWPIVLGILTVSVGMVSLLTTRHLSVILLLAVVAVVEARGKAWFRAVAPIMMVLLAVGAVALVSMRYSSKAQEIDQFTGNFEEIQVSERVLGAFQDRGYIWGGNIPDLFVFMVPRALWPSKPMNSSINRAVFFEYAKLGGVKVVGLLGEGYASGGLFMVAVEGLIYGIMLRRMRAVWERRKANDFQFMAYGAIILGYGFMAPRMGFVGLHVSAFIGMLLQLAITNGLCGYSVMAKQIYSSLPPSADEFPHKCNPSGVLS